MRKATVLGMIFILLLSIFLIGCGETAGEATRFANNGFANVGMKVDAVNMDIMNLKKDFDSRKIDSVEFAAKLDTLSLRLDNLKIDAQKYVGKDNRFSDKYMVVTEKIDASFAAIEKYRVELQDFVSLDDAQYLVSLDKIKKDADSEGVEQTIEFEGVAGVFIVPAKLKSFEKLNYDVIDGKVYARLTAAEFAVAYTDGKIITNQVELTEQFSQNTELVKIKDKLFIQKDGGLLSAKDFKAVTVSARYSATDLLKKDVMKESLSGERKLADEKSLQKKLYN